MIDRVGERRRAAQLARHYRDQEHLTIGEIAAGWAARRRLSRRTCTTRRTVTKGLRIARALMTASARRAPVQRLCGHKVAPVLSRGAFAGPGLKLDEQNPLRTARVTQWARPSSMALTISISTAIAR